MATVVEPAPETVIVTAGASASGDPAAPDQRSSVTRDVDVPASRSQSCWSADRKQARVGTSASSAVSVPTWPTSSSGLPGQEAVITSEAALWRAISSGASQVATATYSM